MFQALPVVDADDHAIPFLEAAEQHGAFRAPKDPTKPCRRHLFDSWLRKAYELLTDIPRERWTLWHSIRRKWATERKGYLVRDVMEAGGWKNEETLLRSYQQPDAETVKRVVLHPTQRIVGSGT